MYMFTLNIAEFQYSLLLQIMSVFVLNCCQSFVHNKQGASKQILFLRKTTNKLFMAKNVKKTLMKPSPELYFIAQTSYLIIDKMSHFCCSLAKNDLNTFHFSSYL